MRTNVKSAARVLDLLELMAALPGPVRLNEAARRLGIPKSSASGLFATLEGKGYVTSAADGYALAEPFRNGGWTGGHYAHLSRVSRPVMMRIVEQTAESAFLGIMTSDWAIQYVDKVVSTNAVRYDADLSQTRPAYNTSIGQVFLASQSKADFEEYLATQPLTKVTPHTVVDRDELRALVQRVRERGYAEVERSNEVDAAGVAAGIVGPSGRIISAVAVFAPASRFPQVRDRAIAAVCEGAAQISDALGKVGRAGDFPLTAPRGMARGRR